MGSLKILHFFYIATISMIFLCIMITFLCQLEFSHCLPTFLKRHLLNMANFNICPTEKKCRISSFFKLSYMLFHLNLEKLSILYTYFQYQLLFQCNTVLLNNENKSV